MGAGTANVVLGLRGHTAMPHSRLVPPTVGCEGQGKALGEGGESSSQRRCQGNRNLFPFFGLED